MTFCFTQLLCLPFERFHLVFLDENKGLLASIFMPRWLYFSIPISVMEELEINGSLSTLPSTVLYRENFFFCKLSTHFSVSYKIIGPRKTWFDIILSLSMLFLTWPKGPLETDTKHCLLLPVYRMTPFSNECITLVMSQNGSLGEKWPV